MGHFYELPKEFHPDFAFPHRKPVGPVEIDWGNPLTKGLAGVYLFNGNTLNLVTKNKLVGGGVSDAVKSGARCAQYTSANPTDTFVQSSKISVYSRVFYTSAAADIGLYEAHYAAAVPIGLFWADKLSPNLRVGAYSAGGPVYGSNLPINSWVSWGGTLDDDTSGAELYINGDLDASGTTGTGSWTGETNPMIGARTGTGSNCFYEYIYVWNRKLTADEFARIDAGPYQIFKPAIPLPYFIPSAGGGYTLSAGSGSYSLNGSAAVLAAARKLSGTSGAYSLSGSSAALRADRKINAASGTYSLSGTDVTLTYTPASSSYTLTGDSGSYALTGANAVLAASRQISAGSGSYSLNGASVGLAYGHNLSASSGAYSISGADVSLVKHSVLQAASGAYGLSGSPITFSYSGSLAYLGRTMVTTDRARAMLTSDQTRTMTASSPQRNMLH